MEHLLDNIFWHSLIGPQATCAVGARGGRRYAQGFSPIVAFENNQQPDFAALEPHCEPGEHFYYAGWSGPAAAGWRIERETTMFRMVWDGSTPAGDAVPEAVRLGAEHVAKMLELTALTNPGPFGPRTLELGEYFGCFEGDRLVAMAGERAHAGMLREISGVCTHPEFQGRGLARRLMLKLIIRQLQRGETPFLHVMSANEGAHRLYLRMGFRDHVETVVRVISPV